MKVLRFGVATVLLAALAIFPVRAANLVIKLGTIVPDGSVWTKSLRQLGETWRKSTDGRVTLRVYAGGTQGSESAMIKRLNFGQLQAASFTAIGLVRDRRRVQRVRDPDVLRELRRAAATCSTS